MICCSTGTGRPVPKPRKNISRPLSSVAESTRQHRATSTTTAGPADTSSQQSQATRTSTDAQAEASTLPPQAATETATGPPDTSAPPSLELISYVPQASIDLTEDPSMCGEYAGEVYVYHRHLEEQSHYLVCAKFMEHQTNITEGHRRVLVDWLAQVHFKYHLLQETMILTVDILDRYLQVEPSYST